MNVIDAAKRLVLAFPGSYAGMAAAMGTSPNVLRNRVSRTNDTHHLGVMDLIEITEQAESANVPDPHVAIRAMAAHFGFQLVRDGHGAGASDLSLAEQLLQAQRTSSELIAAVIQALQDGVIDADELAHIVAKRRAAGQANAEVEATVRNFTTPVGAAA
ncbi:phage regulatory CII family protein [Luteibacter sp. NPDC031894]|uniref:phage regulatory CII family protein n=1 Tax=Luteibacter sp. NPDC031894 TaxID=3390572 RepID=UPI003CFBDA8A